MNDISKQLQTDWPRHMSYETDDADINKFYNQINGAVSEPTSIFYKKRQIDIFLFAMALGVEYNTREKIKKPSISIRVDALRDDEMWMMCSVVLSEDAARLDSLANPKQLIKTCEEYANGGIKILMQLDRRTDTSTQYEESLSKVIAKVQNE